MTTAQKSRSLRQRLMLILLPPMIIVAVGAALWRYQTARTTAETLYDKTLMAVTLAIVAEVATTGGDLLANDKIDLLSDYLGDQIFYRVDGPGEGIVTGYAGAPAPPKDAKVESGKPFFFSARYRDEPVRAAIYRELVQGVGPDSLSGWVQVTTWQTVHERRAFANELARWSLWIMGIVVIAGAAALWIGLRFGLKPLLDLEEAVGKRSQSNLTPIKRPVPNEVLRLVGSMNALFRRLRDAIAARDVFIEDAAHQLRNPIAAIRSQAEAAGTAKEPDDMQSRLSGVMTAAQAASRLATQLLSSEKARSGIVAGEDEFDVCKVVAEIARSHGPKVLRRGGNIEFDAPAAPVRVKGDETMIREAVENLIDNACRYGLDDGGQIQVMVAQSNGMAEISVSDTGPGVPNDARDVIFERFKRAAKNDGDGCGLGLAIVRDVARAHDGDAWLKDAPGTCFLMTLRCSDAR